MLVNSAQYRAGLIEIGILRIYIHRIYYDRQINYQYLIYQYWDIKFDTGMILFTVIFLYFYRIISINQHSGINIRFMSDQHLANTCYGLIAEIPQECFNLITSINPVCIAETMKGWNGKSIVDAAISSLGFSFLTARDKHCERGSEFKLPQKDCKRFNLPKKNNKLQLS